MAGKVGLASIGLGWWGNVLAEAVSNGGRAQIVSCFARGAEGRETFAARHSCRAAGSFAELMADPEVEGVLITTPHSTHRAMIEAVAAAGKHVFVEKPLTATVEEGRGAIAVAAAAGVVLQVGHQRRRNAANRRLKQMIDAGELGEIQLIETHHSAPNALKMKADAWRLDRAESPLGGMTSLGVHKIDTLTYLAGPIRRVFTFTKNARGASSIDQATILSLEFDSGILGTLVTSFFVPSISRINVFGTAASAFNDFDGKSLFVQQTGETDRTEIPIEPNDPVEDELVEFARAIRGETTPETGGAEGLEVVAVMAAAVESADTGLPIDVSKYR